MQNFIKLNRLEFMITYNCSSKCKHCFNYNLKTIEPHINKFLAIESLVSVSKKHNIESIMTFGGEPLLYSDIVCDIHSTAMKLGIKTRELITNAFWSKERNIIEATVKKLIDSGVNKVLISVDAFHQETIDINIVKMAAESFLHFGIESICWNPCWLVSKEHKNDYNKQTLKILDSLAYLNIDQSFGNVVSPQGHAVNNLKEYLPSTQVIFSGKCSNIPYTNDLDNIESICINPDGIVPICPSFILGNLNKYSINQLIESYDPYKDKLMNIILTKGINGLYEYAVQNGIKLKNDGFYSMCDACKQIIQQS